MHFRFCVSWHVSMPAYPHRTSLYRKPLVSLKGSFQNPAFLVQRVSQLSHRRSVKLQSVEQRFYKLISLAEEAASMLIPWEPMLLIDMDGIGTLQPRFVNCQCGLVHGDAACGVNDVKPHLTPQKQNPCLQLRGSASCSSLLPCTSVTSFTQLLLPVTMASINSVCQCVGAIKLNDQ
jgi:hypothetical protein